MVPAGYFLLVIFSNYFTVKRGNLAYFSSFLSLLKSNLKKSLIGSTQLGPFWIAIMNLYIKSFQKIYIFWECLIFCLNQTLAGCEYVCPKHQIPLLRILHLWEKTSIETFLGKPSMAKKSRGSPYIINLFCRQIEKKNKIVKTRRRIKKSNIWCSKKTTTIFDKYKLKHELIWSRERPNQSF